MPMKLLPPDGYHLITSGQARVVHLAKQGAGRPYPTPLCGQKPTKAAVLLGPSDHWVEQGPLPYFSSFDPRCPKCWDLAEPTLVPAPQEEDRRS